MHFTLDERFRTIFAVKFHNIGTNPLTLRTSRNLISRTRASQGQLEVVFP